MEAFSFYVTGKRISIELPLRRTLVRSVSLFITAHLLFQLSTCLLKHSLLLVIATKEQSLGCSYRNNASCTTSSQQSFTALSTDPSFLGIARQEAFLSQAGCYDGVVMHVRHCALAVPLTGGG
jgi:hypothetical protein